MPQLKPTRGIRLNRSHPFSRGLVGFWLFNEGSGGQVFDLSGYNLLQTLSGPEWVASKYGSGVSYVSGNSDYGYVAHSSLIDFDRYDPFTAIVFGKTTAPGRILINKMHDTSPYQGWHLATEATGTISYMKRGGTLSTHRTFVQSQSTTWDSGLPVMIAVTDNGAGNAAGVKLYGNGVPLAMTTTDDDLQGTSLTTSVLDISRFIGSTTGYSTATYDLILIYNRVLSASEVALLYREPFCMFGRVNRPELIGGQIVNLAGSSVALSSLSATAKVMRKVGGNVVGTSDVAALLNSIRSLLEVERDWLREALFNGMTANAFKLGTTLSLGWFWVRVAGCSVLYRGFSMGEIDFVNILAVDEKNALEISPSSYISHNSSSTYFYVVRRFNNCGYQERTLAASVKVSIESNGELAEPQPNKVFASGAELVDGNKIQLVWYYCPLEQKSQPMCFNVYYDGRTGQINYENPLAIIGYKGRKFYSYQCGALEAGRYLFAIRTEDVSGIENSSLARLRIQFDPTNPDAIDILSAEGV